MSEDNPLLQARPTINPYRYALHIIAGRLVWDLDWRSWVSRRRLLNWKDRYAGQKAVIVCNGPSLLKTDLSLLNGVFTFGLNKINLLFDKTAWRPDCVVAINSFVLEQNADFFNIAELPLFLNATSTKLIKYRNNVTFLHVSHQPKIAQDCSISICSGATVTVAALQIAFHMGFKEVALIGCDHNFAQKGPANQVVHSGAKDLSHFDPKYFSGGAKWELPDLATSEFFYHLANDTFSAHKRKIFNCTEGGRLEVFERCSLRDFVKAKTK